MDKDLQVKVVNKYNGRVGYDVPELSVHRQFEPGAYKMITFNELEQLSFVPGGEVILKNYLEIQNDDVIMELFGGLVEPEYHYTQSDVEDILKHGSLDQLLDCLDFAPQVIIDIIKQLAVELPLNDMSKRDAIRNKTGFDVTKAIEIKNTKYDGENEQNNSKEKVKPTGSRRATVLKKEGNKPAPTGRRYQPSQG